MKTGDLVYLRHKIHDDDDYVGLIVQREQVGTPSTGSTILYDILLTETNELITISDIYFDIWRIE